MWANRPLIQNIALTPSTQKQLESLDFWLLDEDLLTHQPALDPGKLADDELCAMYLGYLLRAIPFDSRRDDFYELLKLSYGNFSDRAMAFERNFGSESSTGDYGRNFVLAHLVGEVPRDGHILTIAGIDERTMTDLEARARVVEAILTVVTSMSDDWQTRDGILQTMPDTIVATIAMFFHLHHRLFDMENRHRPALEKPWRIVNEIGRRAALSAHQ